MKRWQTVEPGGGREGLARRRRSQKRGALLAVVAALGLVAGGRALARAAEPARAQSRAPAPGSPAPVSTPAPPRLPGDGPATAAPAAAPSGGIPQVSDLTTRYRFLERYPAEADRAQPGDVGQYRVASRDVIKIATDKPQGTPDRSERVVQVIYTERPAAVSSAGNVTDSVRRYEALRVSPPLETRPSAARPLEGLILWYKTGASGTPLVMSLNEGRRISEAEYGITMRQVFLPDLVGILPALPSRVGDRWRVPPLAAQALFGERPAKRGEPLMGTLQEVAKAPNGAGMVATVTVTGRADLPKTGETLLNARVQFAFTLPSEPPSGAETEKKTGIVDARGAITEVRLARASSSAVPGSNGRMKSTLTWELTLQRQLGSGGPLAVPNPAPTPTEANSWLTYDDPQARFHFRHPQDFLPQRPPFLAKDDLVQLGDSAAGSDEGRIITMRLQPKTGKPAEDKATLDPDSHIKELSDEWVKSRQDVLRGPSGWLPDSEWASNKVRVYRIEAALKPRGPEGRNLPRIFLDYYLAVFAQNESLVLTAMTGQDPPLPFRKQVEAILKTFQLGPSKAAGGVHDPNVPLPSTTTAPVVAPQPVVSPPAP